MLGVTPAQPRPEAPVQTPWEALQAAVLPALQRSPCLVSFSGGLDSALVLAVATVAARRHGLPLPVPCTWRFPAVPATHESEPQREVVGALGLTEWVVLEGDEELDLVGPVAAVVRRGFGLCHPTNLHLHLPLLELARGGSLLTGLGGDQLLGGWRRPRPAPRRWRGRLPVPWRVWYRRRRRANPYPWLHAEVARRVGRAALVEAAGEPDRFDARIRWHAGRRALVLTRQHFAHVAAGCDVELRHPICDPGVIEALARFVGGRPAPRRTELIETITSGVGVPPEVHRPRPKARFGEVFFNRATRQLVSSWDGRHVDPQIVDLGALRRVWSDWPVPLATAGLVQQVHQRSLEHAPR